MTATVDKDVLRSRVKNLDTMPALPAVLSPLMRFLELPPEQVEVEKVSELILHDESLVAQCLRMANSALFSRQKAIESIRGAVVSLGVQRLRDIVWTTLLMRLAPTSKWPLNPAAFWEHSFGTALVSQQLAKKIALPDPEKAYLCGLLHDVGEIVHATLLPDDFRSAAAFAVQHNISLLDAEKQTLGFTHCETGKMLADYWKLPPDVSSVIEFHHAPEQASTPAVLPALVNLADLLCRLRGMGYGYDEMLEIDFHEAPAWFLLQKAVPALEGLDVARSTLELDADAEEIRLLVASCFQT
jgi:putative nucleotidyltransferase with HDIG domain